MLYKNIFEIIWNTPLLEIDEKIHSFKWIKIYAKLEYLNPFWSVKDRTAFWMIEPEIENIKNNKKIIIESSSWNTGKALASMASILWTKFETISNRIKVDEQKEILELLWAKVEQMPWKSECPDPNDPNDPLKMIDEKISKNKEKYFYTDQYKNKKNVEYHFKTTWKEIWEDLWKVDYFFWWLWTTWSTRGTAEFLKEKNKKLKSIWIVSSSDDYIPWIRTIDEMWEVWLFDKDFYENIEEINSLEALDYMKILIEKAWMHCWPTTWATYWWLIKFLEKNKENIPENSKIVFIACDSFSPYLSYIKERKQEFFNKKERDFCVFHIDKKLEENVEYLLPHEINKNYLVIDTRSNISFKNIHIPNSINIEEQNLYEIIDDEKFPFSKELKLVFVCPFWKKSKKISAFLNNKWYETYVLKWWLEERIDLWWEIKNF